MGRAPFAGGRPCGSAQVFRENGNPKDAAVYANKQLGQPRGLEMRAARPDQTVFASALLRTLLRVGLSYAEDFERTEKGKLVRQQTSDKLLPDGRRSAGRHTFPRRAR